MDLQPIDDDIEGQIAEFKKIKLEGEKLDLIHVGGERGAAGEMNILLEHSAEEALERVSPPKNRVATHTRDDTTNRGSHIHVKHPRNNQTRGHSENSSL